MSNASSEPDKSVPWNPWVALLVVAVVFYGAQLLAGLLVSLYPLAQHWTAAQATDWLNHSIPAQFIYIALTEAFTVGAIYWFLRHYQLGLAAIGLKKPRWRDAGYGLLALPVYFIVFAMTVALATRLFPGLNVHQQQEIPFDGAHGVAQLVQTFVGLVVLVPLTEEIMVRGFLYSSLKKMLPVAAAVLTTSLLFASAHLPEGGAAGPLYIAAIDTFVLSLALIYLREKTGSLWASITLHAGKNALAFFALFIAPLLHVVWLT